MLDVQQETLCFLPELLHKLFFRDNLYNKPIQAAAKSEIKNIVKKKVVATFL